MTEIFKVFQNKEEYFELLSNEKNSKKVTLQQIGIIFLFSFFYGVVMGSYNSPLQALVSGLKVPSLLMLALFICFPAFFVIQYMLGSRMTFKQMINMVLSGFVVLTTIMASFAPIVIFFMITGDNYNFLKLLHVAIFAFSGVFGMRTMIEALTFSCEKKDVYPKIGLKVFKFWVVVFAFVGMQLAWNLRPFVGDQYSEFELFREKEGNFYLAVFQSTAAMFVSTAQAEDIEEVKIKEPAKNIEKQVFVTDTTIVDTINHK
ncbi:MAG: hypothetical protein JEZ03_06580 [Bacteroidales bacterium]|nr:hypothetical protein [Bacteroidales bacterium]